MADIPKRSLRVFLCHASPDTAHVLALYRRLVHDGVDAWLDKEKLLPGQNWREEIPKAVRNSDIFLVCISNHSINREGYVQREIREALEVAEEKPEGTIFIIPARLEECDVPARLSKYHWVDLFADDGYQRLLLALNVRAEKIRVESPLPSKEDTQKTQAVRPKENRRRLLAALALAILCGCLAISGLFTRLLAPYLRTPTPTPTLPSFTATSPQIISSPTFLPTDTQMPQATSTTSLISQTTTGPWRSQVDGLELSVDKVEVIGQTGNNKILRFYFSINNQTDVSIRLYLYHNFLAIDENGQTYEPDFQHSDWPDVISPSLLLRGSVNLADPVPIEVSRMKVTFSEIVGELKFIGKSITISEIDVP